MMRLNYPEYTFEQAIDECILGVTGNELLRQNLIASKDELSDAGVQYTDVANVGELHTIQPVNINDDPLVINTLKKSELVKVYNQYFRASEKPARIIYDS